MSTVRAALYLRVSTASKSRNGDVPSLDQNPEVQERPLLELIGQRGWTLQRVYSDRASCVAERRPGLDALLAEARRGAFDVVVVWRVDRFARSVKQLIVALEEFRVLGIDFVSHQEAIDTSTPMGKVTFTIIAAMAELERRLIRERVVSGLEYARQHGTRSGKPVGRPRAVFRRDEAIALRAQDLSWRKIAKRLGTSAATVRRACQSSTEATKPCQNSPVLTCLSFVIR